MQPEKVVRHILCTLPKSRVRTLPEALALLHSCTGPPYHLINAVHLPKQVSPDLVCFILYDGLIRGYMNVVDSGLTESFRGIHRIGKRRNTHSLVLANFHPTPHPYPPGHEIRGFQSWRYTDLRP